MFSKIDFLGENVVREVPQGTVLKSISSPFILTISHYSVVTWFANNTLSAGNLGTKSVLVAIRYR